MAIRTSSQTGNTNSSPFAYGSAVAVGDQLVVASGHTVAVDSSIALGTSPPQTPTALPSISLAAGATVTSLPSGVYQFRYTFVDSGGKESQPTTNIGSGSVVNGTSKPRVTLPALPSGVSSIKLYLSDTGGAAGTEKLYASGITGTTYDLVSASYTDGTTNFASAAAWVSATAVKVNAGGTLTGSGGSVLTCRGDLIIGNTSGTGTLTGWAGGGITFDPSSAASPTAAGYVLWFGDANNFGNNYAKLLTSGTSAGSPFTIQTASGSYKAARMAIGIGAFGALSDAPAINASYVNCTRIGDSASDCFTINSSTGASTAFVQTLSYWIFDACGRANWSVSAPPAGGFSLDHCTWKNGNYQANVGSGRLNPLILAASAALTTGTRSVTNCVFDGCPKLAAYSTTYTGNVFHSGWDNPISTGIMWASFDANFVRWNFQGGAPVDACGPVTNSVFLGDTAPSAAVTGTATSATSTTLTDSTKSWTTNQYAAATSPTATGNTPANKGWFALITGGTGSGQCRSILSNTSTALTALRAWDTTPDATSTYGIYEGAANPHMLSVDLLPAGSSASVSGNVFWYAGADNNGDMIQHLDSGTSPSHCVYTVANNVILPSLARDNSGMLVTIGANPFGEFHVNHNSYFTGSQCLSVNEGVATSMSGVIKEFKSNLAWCEPGKTYALAGAGGGASTLGPLKLVDSSHLPIASGGGATDVVLNSSGTSQADYNAGYGLASAYADQNFAGSGTGYQVKTSIAMGTHDIDGTDPAFVDRWRDPCTWGESLGITGNKLAVLATTLANVRSLNDRSGYDSRFSVSALYSYLRAGQVVQAAALNNAGHDSVTIGAMGYLAPVVVATASGGLTLSGSSAPTPVAVGTGGLTLAGSAPPVPGTIGTGGLVLGDVAIVGVGTAGTGGLILSGTAPAGAGVVGEGGLSLSGSAVVVQAIGDPQAATASGGLALSGSAAAVPGLVGTGGLTLSGVAVVVHPGLGPAVAVASGGLTLSGSSRPTPGLAGSGGLSLSGTATVGSESPGPPDDFVFPDPNLTHFVIL